MHSRGAKRARWAAAVAAVGVAVAAGVVLLLDEPDEPAPPRAPALRLNEIQAVGTHNSYHLPPDSFIEDVFGFFTPGPSNLDYAQPPIPEQLGGYGVRQLELDVFADPDGDRWRPLGVPGWKVFHIKDRDMNANCELLVTCLEAARNWSAAHPRHAPIAVLVEPRDSSITAALLDDLDAEIRSVFAPEQLLVPDDVRGRRPTLEAAVLRDGWPRLDELRGRFMFVLSRGGIVHDLYVAGHPSLEGRVMFTSSIPGEPDAAVVKIDDPQGSNTARIRDLVARGYLVRTRADLPVETPRSGDTTRRDAAFASGAHWVSTDYPVPGSAKPWSSVYVARIDRRIQVRCNPVSAPRTCRDPKIEHGRA